MELRPAYYYIICLVALFVFAWGLIDLTSSLVNLATARFPAFSQSEMSLPSEGASEPMLDLYYQKRMLYDRLSDSLARILISGAIFAYSRFQTRRFEK